MSVSGKKLLDPETDIMDQFLAPETDIKHQFLDPETDIMGEGNYIVVLNHLLAISFALEETLVGLRVN